MGSPSAPSFSPCDAWSIKGGHFHSKFINSNQTNTTKQTSKQNSYKVGNRIVFVSPNQVVKSFFIFNCERFVRCTVTYSWVYVGACHLSLAVCFNSRVIKHLWVNVSCQAQRKDQIWSGGKSWTGFIVASDWHAVCCVRNYPCTGSPPVWPLVNSDCCCRNKLTDFCMKFWTVVERNVGLGFLVTERNNHHWLWAST